MEVNTPMIHKPDQFRDEGDTLFCVFDADRVCNGACVAFDGGKSETGTTCILVNAHKQIAIALVAILKMAKGSYRVPGETTPPPAV